MINFSIVCYAVSQGVTVLSQMIQHYIMVVHPKMKLYNRFFTSADINVISTIKPNNSFPTSTDIIMSCMECH